ncbi:MAG: site-specific DNA-methyltransferase, partial [Firmicutes bacterium]|nr:site-specific DNA-methyltransferase [Bacillota bacterium]
AFLCHIDENEYEFLHILCRYIGIPDGGTIIWDKMNPMLGRKGVATQHEYILWRTWHDAPIYLRSKNVQTILAKAEELIKQYGGVNERVRREFANWISSYEGLTGGERAYRYIDDEGRVYQSVAMGAPEPRLDPKFYIPLIHPVTKKPCPVPTNGWSRSPETLQELLEKGEIIFGKDETIQPRRKLFLEVESKRQLSSIISDSRRGKMDVDQLGVNFPYCHPVSLYKELLGAAIPGIDDIVFDFFAGSGTTGQAVIELNREDGGRRRFILVEMADYFDTVLLPRIKKVIFAPEWKDGKPARMATPEEAARSPRIIKYIRLESYEDALNNISFDEAPGGMALEFEDYFLRYMLKWEARRSETMLNVEKLERPFAYRLHLYADGRTGARPVDLPETFNYLLGLHVTSRRALEDDGRRYLVYRGRRDHRTVAVIWRETAGWSESDYEREKEFLAKQGLVEGADEIFTNGDSLIPGARSLDGLFKSRMFGGAGVWD